MITKPLLVFLCLVYSGNIFALQPDTVDINNEGIEFLKNEEPDSAYAAFLEALSKEPFNPAIRLNLGLSFEAKEDFVKAYKEYMSAYRYAKQDEIKFYALFNAGNAARGAKQIDQALEAYQKALALVPDSKEVKKNIELLWQGGGGGGEGEDENKDNKDPGNQGQQPNPEKQQKKKKPQEFKSKQLSKSDVRKILEELKNQEQKIRAKEYEKGPKSAPKDKDW